MRSKEMISEKLSFPRRALIFTIERYTNNYNREIAEEWIKKLKSPARKDLPEESGYYCSPLLRK